jgi:cell division septation protein DedD
MRVLVFLLVLANLSFLVWSRGYLGSGKPDAPRAADPLRAEQIRIVSNDQPPVEWRGREKSAAPPAEAPSSSPAPTPPEPQPAAPPHEVCAVLAEVPPAEADALERRFAGELPAFKVTRAPAPDVLWAVYIPALKTRREAENKVGELKRLDVTEYYIMQDGGEGFSISLGQFSTQGAAESMLGALKAKGVRSARLTTRPRKTSLSRMEFLGPELQAEEMRRLIGEALPAAKLAACAQGAVQ